MDKALQPPNLRTWGRPPSGQQPFTTCKWTRVAPQPFMTCKWTRVGGPATLHDKETAEKWTRVGVDFQMDKGWGPSQPRFANGQGWGPTLHDSPPNPSRLANGQGLGAPQPFMTCKWTRVGGPATLHHKETAEKWTRVGVDFQMDKGWGPSQPRFANGQGWGPTLHDSPPNPSRLANGQGLGAPQPFTTCKWTTVGQGLGPPGVPPITSTAVGQGLDPLNLSRFGGGSPNKLYRFNIRFQADQASCPKIDKSMTGPFGPERTPTQTFKFCLDKHWGLQTIERLSIFLRGPGASPQIETSMTSPSSQNVRYCRASFKFCLNRDSRPKVEKSMTGPFGPERTPTQTSNFDWTSIGASKPSNA